MLKFYLLLFRFENTNILFVPQPQPLWERARMSFYEFRQNSFFSISLLFRFIFRISPVFFLSLIRHFIEIVGDLYALPFEDQYVACMYSVIVLSRSKPLA